MPRSFDDFLNEGSLVLEIGLKLEDALMAAVIRPVAFLAFPAQPRSKQTTFGENGFDSFLLIGEIDVIEWKDHRLGDFLTVTQEPPIVHASLLSRWPNIHA